MGLRPRSASEVDLEAGRAATPEPLYGISHLARKIHISRSYVAFLARRRIFPFSPTHEFSGDAGARSQALFTADRLATVLRCYTTPEAADLTSSSEPVVLVYGVTYLAQLLGYSRSWISPLVQERVIPFLPSHELVREDGRPGPALFTLERLQSIVAVRHAQALVRCHTRSAERGEIVLR